MSVPARKAPTGSGPARKGHSPWKPPRSGAGKAARSRSPSADRDRAGRSSSGRKRHHLGFAIVAGLLVGSMVVGIVSLNALAAQDSFQVQHLQDRAQALSDSYLRLTRQEATLSAPGRIDEWARKRGMVLPENIHILHVQRSSRSHPAGEAEQAAQDAALKPIVSGTP